LPAGLMLYWVTTNLWTTGQGLITRKLRPTPAPPEKRTSRTPPGGDGKAPPEAQPAVAAKGQPRRVKRKKKRARR
jgi:YidC/Oxa1 family membrane protein insertase